MLDICAHSGRSPSAEVNTYMDLSCYIYNVRYTHIIGARLPHAVCFEHADAQLGVVNTYILTYRCAYHTYIYIYNVIYTSSLASYIHI